MTTPKSTLERILVVDDDEGLLTLLRMRLTSFGFDVTTCSNGKAAITHFQDAPFDFAILDVRMPDMSGLTVMEELLQLHPALPVLILTAHGCIPDAVEAMKKGAYSYLTKPFDDKELHACIDKALSQKRMTQEIHRLKMLVNELYGMENVVARSPQMQAILQQVSRVADTNASVCIVGETGTGKEVIARVLHCNSSRASGPFVGVNCAAIPDSLFESELFGHTKGSFTGAYQSKTGLFETGHRGTLFLDEIGEMPLALQGKLLRAIQEREVLPIGARHPTKIDVRLITATNQDLNVAVQEGRFREDLFYRIQVVPIALPPLRERRQDIPSLAQHFLKKSAARANKAIRGFVPDALQKLTVYSWPGNIRELENVVEHAVIMASQDMITPDLLPIVRHSGKGTLVPLTEAKESFERDYLKSLLEITEGNISRASQIAGRYRSDFYKLLKKYHLYPANQSDSSS
ncbi:sigma-54 dependent transcriptional regulator [Candidatus Nitronereus thalassa]|uniref:Sigma-54 dependent transcriptional regulator n=1 Tax=Candidatus Nitronereus thalassa TaxID=3020898 RepID=A0ABU3K6G2_9BACT|nr:sigma-54 dependent transcriptional regulator [Candidatus Nitronereus thalassa]MDT7041961.1 sigma-54 dependent transcriptional regulator [Candidatus Nitronereus thalassa]